MCWYLWCDLVCVENIAVKMFLHYNGTSWIQPVLLKTSKNAFKLHLRMNVFPFVPMYWGKKAESAHGLKGELIRFANITAQPSTAVRRKNTFDLGNLKYWFSDWADSLYRSPCSCLWWRIKSWWFQAGRIVSMLLLDFSSLQQEGRRNPFHSKYLCPVHMFRL